MDQSPLFLSIPDTAKVIGVGETKVKELVADRKLTSTRVGRRRLIFASSVQSFHDELLAGATDVPDSAA